jgi:hypothetical protein
MKHRLVGFLAVAAALVTSVVLSAQTPMDHSFTYQGQIKQNGSPYTGQCDFQFALYNSVSGTTGQIGTTETKAAVTVSNGLFSVSLNFGPAFQGNKTWLDIQARCPSGSGSYVALSPRQQLQAAPYALGLPGLHSEMNVESPNIIGGWAGNGVSPGVVGAVIGGGGTPSGCGTTPPLTNPCPNRVTDHYGVVGGGFGNQAGNNAGAATDAVNSTVGGGYANTASRDGSTVGGGYSNTANGSLATVGGGMGNTAGRTYSTIPGGYGAVSQHYGEMAYASGSFEAFGDAQTSLYVLRNTTSDATKTYLFLDGILSTYRIWVAANRALTFEIQVIGTSDSLVTAGFRIRGVLKNSCGTMTMVGATGDILGKDAGAASWNAVAEVDDTNDALAVAVTGAAGINIRWVASVRTTEVAWSLGCILP